MNKKKDSINKDAEKNEKGMSKGSLITFIVVFAILFARLTGLLSLNMVEGQSMIPTYHTGDYVVGSNIPVSTNELKRGDIVIVLNDEKVAVIKRIIGLPGETVHYSVGKMWIDGEQLDESSYINDEKDVTGYAGNYVLKSDQYFICGDNRNDSRDSRSYGPISKSQILAKVSFSIPFSKIFK